MEQNFERPDQPRPDPPVGDRLYTPFQKFWSGNEVQLRAALAVCAKVCPGVVNLVSIQDL